MKTVYTHFFTSVRDFEKMPPENANIEFTCKICNNPYKSSFQNVSNLKKHLDKHQELDSWRERYSNHRNKKAEKTIDDSTYRLVKFIVSTNMSLTNLKK